MSSSSIIEILFANLHLQLSCLTETFFVLDFVLKIAPQQGQRKLAIVRNILHIEHLFCPISYGNKGIWNILKLKSGYKLYNAFEKYLLLNF